MRILTLLSLFCLFALAACSAPQDSSSPQTASAKPVPPVQGHFPGGLYEYWYEGLAEINTYELTQARYGELRPGSVTAIFVSEDFLTDKQVKNDNYTNPNSTGVLKTNLIRRFVTGIYDYSLMSSVFTPAKTDEHPHTLKVTTSMQDWCGQTFTQLNYAGADRWDAQLRSYFEKEGDVNKGLNADFLEDEVFNRIRMNGSDGLPTGSFNVVPSTSYLLMTHKPYQAARATVSVGDYAGDDFTESDLKTYTIDYGSLGRKLEVVFDSASPYVIRGWTEIYPSRGNTLTTLARLSKQKRAPYWSQNKVSDAPLRAELDL